MKKIYFLALLLFSQQLFSQYVSSGIGKWKLGLNIGATWQTADVSTDLFDLGYGATLEYALHEKQNSFFAFSLRGRFLQGKTTGYDYLTRQETISNNSLIGSIDTSINYSFSPIYLNNKTSLNEFSLEAMLKWNRLYQNHGILFYIYLGGGFTSYKVETDQLDFDGSVYNYGFINEGNGVSTVAEIKNLQDGSYETELSNPNYNTLVFTPAIGVGLGFRIVPGLDFALEHKISLPQTDLFDGQQHQTNSPSFIQDIYHYTSLGLIFSIVHPTNPESYVPPVEPITPITTNTTPTTIKPIITLTNPITNSFNSPNCKVEIKAKIENVTDQSNIEFYHNGNKVSSYNYFFSPPIFKSTIELAKGNNNFKIIAKNGQFTETKEFSLTCNNITSIPICHKLIDGSFVTINITEKEWASHAAHGDTKGNCPEKQITICHLIPGGAGKTETISIPESKWAIHKSHGDVQSACNEKVLITICHNNQALSIDEKDWASHAAHGDTKGNCPQVTMITICHVPTQGNQRVTMSIKESEWITHQAHGDIIGTCPAIEPTINICHNNPNGTKTNLIVPEFKWNEHFSHGDSKGTCPEIPFIICHNNPSTGQKENISIYESGWAQHAAHGDIKGACPVVETQLTICHHIPGQLGKTQTITIPESKWQLHKSHGDQLGVCIVEEKIIPICHFNTSTGKKENINIKESEWNQHAAHGDSKGLCPKPVKQITICHHIPGNDANTQTISIPENEWSTHQAHGDQLGECPKPIKYIMICHHIPGKGGETQTISIKESEWNIHQSHGDQLGACTVVDNDIQICHHDGNTKTQITIKESQWNQHAAHGDTKGICPVEDKKITICHYPPGKGNNPQTIQISASAWQAHQAHGDTKGDCSSSTGSPDTPTSTKMIICHIPNEKGASPQTIQISPEEWSVHQAHGDTKGECATSSGSPDAPTSTRINICHTPTEKGASPQNIQISPEEWPAHQAHGDTKGDCATDSKKSTTVIKGKKP